MGKGDKNRTKDIERFCKNYEVIDWRNMEEKIITIISEVLNLPRSEIKMNMNLRDDLMMREVDLVEITVNLEDEFNIEIRDDEFGRVRRVGDVINYIRKKINK